MMRSTTDLAYLADGPSFSMGVESYPELAWDWGAVWEGTKRVLGGALDIFDRPELLTAAAAAAGAAVGIPPTVTFAAITAVRAAVAERGGKAGPMTVNIDGVEYDLSTEQVTAMAGDVVQEETIAGIPTKYVLWGGAAVVLYLVIRK